MACQQMLRCCRHGNHLKSCDRGSRSHDVFPITAGELSQSSSELRSHDRGSKSLVTASMSHDNITSQDSFTQSCDILTTASAAEVESEEVRGVASSLASWSAGTALSAEEERRLQEIKVMNE